MHNSLIDDAIPELASEAVASDPALVAGLVSRISGTGPNTQVWVVLDGFDGYEWGPLEHRPFMPGETPAIGSRCSVARFDDEYWLIGVDATETTTSEWYIGSGVPSSGLGDDGALYLDTAGDAWYGPKTSGAWGSAHPIGPGPALPTMINPLILIGS